MAQFCSKYRCLELAMSSGFPIDVIESIYNQWDNSERDLLNKKETVQELFVSIAYYDYCRKEYLDFFLRMGAEINGKNIENRTAIFMACKNTVANNVKLLLALGADPNIPSLISSGGSYTNCFSYLEYNCGGSSKTILDLFNTHQRNLQQKALQDKYDLMETKLNNMMNLLAQSNIALPKDDLPRKKSRGEELME